MLLTVITLFFLENKNKELKIKSLHFFGALSAHYISEKLAVFFADRLTYFLLGLIEQIYEITFKYKFYRAEGSK